MIQISRDLKRQDAFNRTWWPVLSTDKCCQVTDLSDEGTDRHVLFDMGFLELSVIGGEG